MYETAIDGTLILKWHGKTFPLASEKPPSINEVCSRGMTEYWNDREKCDHFEAGEVLSPHVQVTLSFDDFDRLNKFVQSEKSTRSEVIRSVLHKFLSCKGILVLNEVSDASI